MIEETEEAAKTQQQKSTDEKTSLEARTVSNATTTTTTTTNSSNPDLINLWTSYIKHGSAIVKAIDDCGKSLKKVIAITKKVHENEHMTPSDNPKTSSHSLQTALKNSIREVKRGMCSLAEMLSINIRPGEKAFDLDKEEILDVSIKKV